MSSIKYLLVMLFSIAVVACGGGGGGSSAPATYAISGTITGASGVVAVGLSGTSTATTSTASNGTYSFTGLANGSYTVIPTLAGYAFTPTSTAVTVSGANVTGKNFTATAAATTYTISGSAGIAGATITLSGANSGTLTAGTGGAYTFSGLVNGSYTVTPSLTGYTFAPTSASVTISSANATATTFVPTAIPVAHTLSGNVSPSLSGVTITVTGTANATTTTDASGNYSFTGATGLYDGTYTVTPTKTGYTFTPNSTSVTMAGANVTGKNFAGTANSAVTATANGTVTGAWVQGVTITLSGGSQSGTTTTSAGGNYSFGNLPSGQTYTFTPTLSGYTFGTAPTATVPAGSSTAVTVPAITATSAIASNSISGTVTYTGTQTGPVAVFAYQTGCTGCSSNGGTLITLTGSVGSKTGSYTIRGVPNSTYNIVAGMDALGTGLANSADPVGTAAADNTAGAVANANITLTDPTVTAPAAPSIGSVSPGSGTAFIQYNPPLDGNGLENATSYTVYWGTDAATATVGGSSATFAANGTNNSFDFVHGLTNSSVLYFKLTATNSAGTSAASAVTGPVTIGAVAGANTVTGTVSFTGTASGPLMVIAHANGSGPVYYAIVGSQASPPASGATYTITGVPAGSYQLAVVIDNNNNWLVDSGDFTYGFQGNVPAFAVSGTTTQNVTMTTASATAFVQTSYYSNSGGSGYNLNAGASDGNKHVVNVTLISGPNVAVPFDMGIDPNNNSTNVNLNGFTPAVNDSYGFLVTYSDGSTQIISAPVTGVLTASNLAQNLAVSTASGLNTPTFSWTAPATLPTATPFIYRLQDLGTNGIEVPSGTTSVNLATKGVTLSTGTYYWQVEVRDANSNTAQVQATTPYTAP